MKLGALEDQFKLKSEMEVVRLMTFNFNLGTLALVEDGIHRTVLNALKNAVKFRTHLSMNPTTLDNFINKFEELENNSNIRYTGKSSKMCGYSGKMLDESQTLLGKDNELVSHNEAEYVVKIYPWWIKTINSAFQETVDTVGTKFAFICDQHFNLTLLEDKADVESVSEKYVKLFDGTMLHVIRVEV